MPICEKCAQSDALCETCQKKLDNGEISQLDIKIARLLYELYEKNVLGDPSFERSIELPDFIVIITKSNVSTLIGKGGRVVRILSEKLGKRVRIVKKGSIKEIVNDLVSPARIMGFTTIYSKEGEKQRILIPEADRKKILLKEESIKQVLKQLCGVDAEIKYVG